MILLFRATAERGWYNPFSRPRGAGAGVGQRRKIKEQRFGFSKVNSEGEEGVLESKRSLSSGLVEDKGRSRGKLWKPR